VNFNNFNVMFAILILSNGKEGFRSLVPLNGRTRNPTDLNVIPPHLFMHKLLISLFGSYICG
jgi:hypothetical protein